MSSARSTYVPARCSAPAGSWSDSAPITLAPPVGSDLTTGLARTGSDTGTLAPPVAFDPIESLYRGTPQAGLPARPRHYEPPLRPPTGVEGYGWLFRPECGPVPLGPCERRRAAAAAAAEDTMAWSFEADPQFEGEPDLEFESGAESPSGVEFGSAVESERAAGARQPVRPAELQPPSAVLAEPLRADDRTPEVAEAPAAERDLLAGAHPRRSALVIAGLAGVSALAPALLLLTVWF